MKTLEDITLAVSSTLAQYDVRKAYLFGSFARGEETPESDIDLRLVCGPTITYSILFEITEKLEKELGCPVEIVTNPIQFMKPHFREHIQQDEVLLYEAA